LRQFSSKSLGELEALGTFKFNQVSFDSEPDNTLGPPFAKSVVRGNDEIAEP
jgi:hypothetical protein